MATSSLALPVWTGNCRLQLPRHKSVLNSKEPAITLEKSDGRLSIWWFPRPSRERSFEWNTHPSFNFLLKALRTCFMWNGSVPLFYLQTLVYFLLDSKNICKFFSINNKRKYRLYTRKGWEGIWCAIHITLLLSNLFMNVQRKKWGKRLFEDPTPQCQFLIDVCLMDPGGAWGVGCCSGHGIFDKVYSLGILWFHMFGVWLFPASKFSTDGVISDGLYPCVFC